ncbi:hypothetical protein THAOC_30086 [Thalassiosira oceanica]|uniref:Uncharacterized protein n=1 Tax=Thalassiosira oceanica TaxID=159749 RepID=K0RVU5_THAOC|nr:hypothetical protein THAOC_30086 [Thalassiosira oceanica]|eukprot:EJK50812.1 hypothetical protein THAOC_30086 [Thalassiosira oceanica]
MADDQSSKRLMTTVDLSRVDTSLVTHIASFVGMARELLNLALTCKSFGGLPPGLDLDWSLAKEVAREAVCSGRNDTEGVHTSRRGDDDVACGRSRVGEPAEFDTLWGGGIDLLTMPTFKLHMDIWHL